MTTLSLILEASPAAQASSEVQNAATATQPSSTPMLIMLVVVFIIMYIFMIRPQRKQQKELEKFRAGLKKGDKIVTVGGIFGTVDQVDERTALIKVDGDVKLRVDKASLVRDFSDTQAK